MVSGLMDRPYMNRAVHFSAMSLDFHPDQLISLCRSGFS